MDKNQIINKDFQTVLSQIQNAKQKAYSSVNTILIELYWEIGKYISTKTTQENWGKGVVKELATFLKEKDPTSKGFGDKNLWLMKQFFETYKEDEKLYTLCREISWSNNRRIMSLQTIEEREFYLVLSIKNRYSYRELDKQINTSTFERTMIADKKLSTVLKELPQNVSGVFKDSYIVDFLDLPHNHKEKDLQNGLIGSLKEFILELGLGFAFIGQEYRVQVGNEDFYIDLLFFHRTLQCLVAFELKVGKFKPSDLGQLEFYLEALDRDVKQPQENPSIGVLLCREKNDEVVEYALSRTLSPTVISQYKTKLIPKEILQQKMNELYEQLENEEN
uniref:PDDEXK nuclease domain-containing protein n=1 Tax=Aliarcobacter sp. TaxID=2321116 RepID=UPI004047ADF8